jgi:hypothetical protein
MPKDALYDAVVRFRLDSELKARLVHEAARRRMRASDLLRELIAASCPVVKSGRGRRAGKHAVRPVG